MLTERAGRSGDVDALREIERASNSLFAAVGMASIAGLEATPAEDLISAVAEERLWVVSDAADTPVAFILVRVLDGNAHIDQVAVRPDWMRRGIGRRLINHAALWARASARTMMTLTTFVDVPWNAPYYRRLGFQAMEDDRIGPDLALQVSRNRGSVLGRWPRVVMVRPV